MIFSAHGVAPCEWERAQHRDLRVIDATCPLVTKVHLEVARYAEEGRTVILVGHAGHEEVNGTLGVAPGRVLLVASVAEAERAAVPDCERVAAVTQTTLSVDDTREIMEALKRRFPALRSAQDRRYLLRDPESAERGQGTGQGERRDPGGRLQAEFQRQSAGRGRPHARRPRLPGGLDRRVEPAMVAGVRALGLTASASSPEWLVEEIIACFAERGAKVELMRVAEERVRFPLPMAE